MKRFEKKLAKTTLENAAGIERVGNFAAHLIAGKIRATKQEVKDSYLYLSFFAKLKTLAADALIGASFIPMTIPFIGAAYVASVFSNKVADKIAKAAFAPIDLRKKLVQAKEEKNKDRKAMLDKCDAVMSDACKKNAAVIVEHPPMAKFKLSAEELTATFVLNARRKFSIESQFQYRKDRASRQNMDARKAGAAKTINFRA